MTKSLLVLLLACAGAANADIWHSGDLLTYTQADWGGDPGIDPGATLLVASFDAVYGAAGGVIVGSTSRFTMVFTDADSVLAYIPSSGLFAPLNASVNDPISTVSGGFGGEVLGLELNVDFSDAGLLPGASGIRFGDLILTNFNPRSSFNDLTVRQFLGDVNSLLSGGSSVFTIADLGPTVGNIHGSFLDGTPSPFAQNHLVAPASPVPEPSSLPLLIVATLGLGFTERLRQCRRARPPGSPPSELLNIPRRAKYRGGFRYEK